MEKTKQKSKKEEPNKYLEKEKSSSFISDVKAFKENLKIRELLKTVKMNSNMRIKAPRGSKVMQNKDFNDNKDFFDDVVISGGQQVDEPPSATNTVLNREKDSGTVHEESIEEEVVPTLSENKTDNASSVFQKSKRLSLSIDDFSKDDVTANTLEYLLPPAERAGAKSRDRKLSLDHTMLLRREGLSQSELDLNSIGKSPLERKSSFFRKKMDSFVRNTTEIFKRQSMSNKSTRSPVTPRRDSTSSRMSVSLQSLNEDSTFFEEFKNVPLNTYRDQQSSVSSLATPRTESTLSINVNDRLLEQADVYTMAGSPLPEDQLADNPSTSTHSLNKEPIQDSLLNTRAISMSSGLDTATGQRRRRKTSRSNRVSWLASESLTDYFRRLIQDEKSKEIQGWQSNQDFSAIPENRVGSKMDSKGRRLSYMRAVSGEDPTLASSFRKKKLMESEVPRSQSDLDRKLASYSKKGIPPLESYKPHVIPEEAWRFVQGAVTEEGFLSLFPRRANTTGAVESLQQQTQQAILQELAVTEAQYISHLDVLVNVYFATAHALQKSGFLLYTNLWMVFSYILDIYNSALMFWELAIYPMLRQSKRDGNLLNPELIIPGFLQLPTLLEIYEDHMREQTTSMEYFRNINTDPDFCTYLDWCHQHANTRLQLADMLIKPMQRLTKYNLIISRLINHVADVSTQNGLEKVLYLTNSYIAGVNRAVRQREETEKLTEMRIDSYEPEYRGDEEIEKTFRQHAIIDLHGPMIDCGTIGRCFIHHAMVRFKDSIKEFDVHVLLFTDMLLICKKLPKAKEKDKKHKKEYTYWKMLRPKVMLNRLILAYKTDVDVTALAYVILDELGSSQSVFQLSESPKDAHGMDNLRILEMKVFEAMVTYFLTKWYFKHPPWKESIVDEPISEEDTEKISTDFDRQRQRAESAAEKEARERAAAMLHRKENVESIKKEQQGVELQLKLMSEYAKCYPDIYDSQTVNDCAAIYNGINIARKASEPKRSSINEGEGPSSSSGVVTAKPTASAPAATSRRRSSMAAAIASGIAKNKTNPVIKDQIAEKILPYIRAIFEKGIASCIAEPLPSTSTNMMIPSCGSSFFRLGSELPCSMSYGSHEELRPDPVQRSGSALEPNRPAFLIEGRRSPAIQVHMIPENTQILPSPRSVRAPTVVLQESSPNHSPGHRSASACSGSDNTLRVASQVTLVHSMPDINAEIRRVLSANLEPRPMQLTASERLYRSHQELLYKNRLAAEQHYLKPDHRGSSYPPPSPRALQRGDAVSFSFLYPSLTRTKNVPERASAPQIETPRRVFGRRSPQSDMATGAKSPRRQRSPSPIPRAVRPPGEKPEKNKRALQRGDAVSFSGRHPPLTRTQNVPERATTPTLESPRRVFGRSSPQSDMATGAKSPRRQRSPSPIPRAVRPMGEKQENRDLFLRERNKDFQNSPVYDECDADDDRTRRSNQEKGKQRVERSIAEDVGSPTTDDQDDAESEDSPKKGKDKV